VLTRVLQNTPLWQQACEINTGLHWLASSTHPSLKYSRPRL
jgi:hypothetical protein